MAAQAGEAKGQQEGVGEPTEAVRRGRGFSQQAATARDACLSLRIPVAASPLTRG